MSGKRMRGELVVNGHSAQWLRKGFPWVYPKEVVQGDTRVGHWVLVKDQKGEVLGWGLRDDGWLAVRMFRLGTAERVDASFVHGLLDRAAEHREWVVGPETTGYRLVNGENDGLPGVRVDWWSHYAVIILDTASVASVVPHVVSWLEERRSPRGVYLCYRPDHRDGREVDDSALPAGLIAGHEPTGPVVVRERGLNLLTWPAEGPDVGVYADMREVRRYMEPYWGGTSVLNTFSFTGAFSISAAMNGASEVVTVDLSAKYLERAEANYVANDFPVEMGEFLQMDTFKALDRFRRQGRTFDRIVLDPPSFSHSKAGTWSAKKDYSRLVAGAARVMNPGGWLIAASNLGEVPPKTFRGWVQDGLRKANMVGQELYWGGQGPDFPAATWFPEGRYLKVGIWRILPGI